MKSKMNVLRKGIVSVMILASVFAFAANAVEAVSVTVLGNYVTSLDQDRDFYPVNFMDGHFQTGNSNHNGRACTHFNPGSFLGKALTTLHYNTTKNNNVRVSYDGASTQKNIFGWIESSWVTAPKGYTSCSKIYCYGKRYNDSGNLIYIGKINVNN